MDGRKGRRLSRDWQHLAYDPKPLQRQRALSQFAMPGPIDDGDDAPTNPALATFHRHRLSDAGVPDTTTLHQLQQQFNLMHGSPAGSSVEHSDPTSPLLSPSSGASLGTLESEEVTSNPSQYLVDWYHGLEKDVGIQVPKEIETIIMRREYLISHCEQGRCV